MLRRKIAKQLWAQTVLFLINKIAIRSAAKGNTGFAKEERISFLNVTSKLSCNLIRCVNFRTEKIFFKKKNSFFNSDVKLVSVSRLHQSWPCLIPLIPVRVYGVSHRSEKITPAHERNKNPLAGCVPIGAHITTPSPFSNGVPILKRGII